MTTWEVEYLDVLRQIPETLRKDPPASNYRPLHWKRDPKIHNTRSRARCQPRVSTPKHSSTDGSGSDQDRIRHPPQRRRAADRAAAKATTADQLGEAKGHESAGTTNRLLEVTGILKTILHHCLHPWHGQPRTSG